jgi:hypothetical protein
MKSKYKQIIELFDQGKIQSVRQLRDELEINKAGG